ncbi:MAG: HPF/RaiA family ribosome-associated protein [Janthinobacterium lividum]
MDRPLEIAFHGLQGSSALEDNIRAHVTKLEGHCKGLVSCRVTVEAGPSRGQPHGHVSVRIMLGLPGRELVVTHEPHHEKENRQHSDAYSAVRDAFRVAERQVQAAKA